MHRSWVPALDVWETAERFLHDPPLEADGRLLVDGLPRGGLGGAFERLLSLCPPPWGSE